MKLIYKTKYILIGLTALLAASCSTNTSSGLINEVIVVFDEESVDSPARDSLKVVLDGDIPCLPQPEPFFSVSVIPLDAFSDMFKSARNIILIDVDDSYTETKLKGATDEWAAGQKVLNIIGPDVEDIASTIGKNKDVIRDYFINAEHKRSIEVHRSEASSAAMDSIEKYFNFSMVVPQGFNRFKVAENFLWMSNSNNTMRQNIVLYTYPYDCASTFTREMILHKRDSVMMINMPGPSEDSYMGTEYRYDPPVFKHTKLENGEYASEVRGLWTVIGDAMGGPFVSLTCYDKKNNTIITAEAYIYGPNQNKRNVLRSLESVLYTIKTK